MEHKSDNTSCRKIRIGKKYQAIVPNILSQSERNANEYLHEDDCTWSPPTTLQLNDQQVDDYIKNAEDVYGYNIEQALGLLFLHEYNFIKAKADLKVFGPLIKSEAISSDEDKIIFEQAYGWHGKNFDRIEEEMVGKSLQAIIEYYYLAKYKILKNKKKKRRTRRVCLRKKNF